MMKQDRERLLEGVRLKALRLAELVEAVELTEARGLVVSNAGAEILNQTEALVLLGRSLQL